MFNCGTQKDACKVPRFFAIVKREMSGALLLWTPFAKAIEAEE